MNLRLPKALQDKWTRLLALLLGFHIVSNSLWLFLNKAPIGWDPASHTWLAIQIATFFQQLNFYEWLKASNYYPIFIHTFVSLFILFFGVHISLLQFFDTLFFAAGLISIFLYFSLLFSDKKIGFLASLLFSLFPVVYNQSHFLMLDIPLTSFLFATLYLLQKSQTFTHKKYTIAFFVAAGILLMTKWVGGIFLVIPGIFVLREFLKMPNKVRYLPQIGCGIGALLVIVLPWYLLNAHDLLFLSQINAMPDGNDPTNLLSVDNILYYVKSLINDQITFVPALLFFASLYLFIRSRSTKKTLLLLQLGFCYVVLTIIGNKDPRYFMPLLPYVAGIISWGIVDFWQKKVIKTSLLLILFTSLVFYYFVLNFGLFDIPSTKFAVTFPVIGSFTLASTNDEVVKKYDGSVWPEEQILRDIEQNSSGLSAKVIVAYDNEHFNPSTMNLYLKKGNFTHEYTNLQVRTPDITFLTTNYHKAAFPSTQALNTYLQSYQYIVVSPQSVGYQYLRNNIALLQLQHAVFSTNEANCERYAGVVAKPKTTCYVQTGEEVYTGSDVRLNQQTAPVKDVKIKGYATVYCPWGCSFRVIKQAYDGGKPKLSLINNYVLPNKEQLYLYKISK